MLRSIQVGFVAVLALTFSVTALAHNHGGKKDIVETAMGDEQFSTLVTAIEAAGLVETLQGEGPFTVFAPTNEAFEALPAGTLESLLDEANQGQLQAVLTYHVVAGEYMSSDLAGQEVSVETVQGSPVAIDATDGVTVGGATVIKADIKTSNGVIHVIDQVILPPSE